MFRWSLESIAIFEFRQAQCTDAGARDCVQGRTPSRQEFKNSN